MPFYPYGRDVIGTPEPPTSRRKLDRVAVLLAHEVGVQTSPTGRYRSADPESVLDDATAAARYGISAGKTWEYNYMIGLDGSVFTQAGEYMAAHCLNYNVQSAGVIFLNALDVPANAAQCEAWHELRDHMIDIGTLTEGHAVAPHYRYRATSCPGLRAEAPGGMWDSPTGEGRLGNLIPALLTHPADPTPAPPTPSEDIDMIALDYTATEPDTVLTWDGLFLAWVENGNADAVLRQAGVQRQTVDREKIKGVILASRTTTREPWTLDPELAALWKSRAL